MVVSTPSRKEKLQVVARMVLGDPYAFSRAVIKRPLMPHQVEAIQGIWPYVYDKIPDPHFTIMMSRQGGKNELSAQFEAWLLNRHARSGGQIVKGAPTFKPQIVTSKLRLEDVLTNWWNKRQWKSSHGYMVTLGRARVLFFSTDPQANVVGATASLIMEVDEAQDVDQVVFDKNFAPMRATTNAPVVHYGTSWTSDTMLAAAKEHSLQLQRKDGIRRHFEYNWEKIAEFNPAYRTFVESQIAKMGEDHPIIKTQYKLIEIDAEGALFSPEQLAMMAGQHARWPNGPQRKGFQYIAGIDIASGSEQKEEDLLRRVRPRKDSTVVTIARLDWSNVNELVRWPRMQIVNHYWWTGRGHGEQLGDLIRLLRDVWECDIVVSDAGGVGAGITDLLKEHLGGRVVPYFPNATTKSELGYELLSAVNTGRFEMYAEETLSKEAKEFWFEMENADYTVAGMQKMSFFVPEDVGHDDFLSSAALCAWAGHLVSGPVESRGEQLLAKGRR